MLGGLGTGDGTKTDEFSEKFQMAFVPPFAPTPHFRKIILQSFRKALFKALYKGPKSAL